MKLRKKSTTNSIFIRITTVSTVAGAQTALELWKNQEEELGRGAAVLGHAGK